jgi:hypothetical protein
MSVILNGTQSDLEQPPDPLLARRIARLQRLAVWQRWLSLVLLWLTLGWWSLWELRESLVLLLEYFSWPGVIYGGYFHLWGGGGLLLCLLFTCSSIIWQIGHSFGVPSPKELHQLAVKVNQIQAKGNKHWLWRWIQVD